MNWTIKSILDVTKDFFIKKGIESPGVNAEILLAHALNYENRLNLYLDFDKVLTSKEVSDYRALVQERLKRVPCQYIVKEGAFLGRVFKVNPNVLIPRPETELLVEKCLDTLRKSFDKDDDITGVDVGCGSGVIFTSLKKESDGLNVFGLDVSFSALKISAENYRDHIESEEIACFKSDLLDAIKSGSLDFIVSNPPYVTEEEWGSLMPEVRDFEPKLALVATDEGLSFYKRLIVEAERVLKPQGWVFFEIGETMGEALKKELEGRKCFSQVEISKDFNHKDRYLKARFNKEHEKEEEK